MEGEKEGWLGRERGQEEGGTVVGGGVWPRNRGKAEAEMVPGHKPGVDYGMVTNELGIRMAG